MATPVPGGRQPDSHFNAGQPDLICIYVYIYIYIHIYTHIYIYIYIYKH